MQEHSYDSLGQCTTVVDTGWIRTAANDDPVLQRKTLLIDYDDWGHVCRVTESNSVVTSSFMVLVTLTCREDANGQNNNRETQLDNFDIPTKRSLLNRDDTVYATAEATYDGLGQLIQQKDAKGRVTQYQLDAFDRITQITWPGGRVVNAAFTPQSAAALPISIETNNYVLVGQSFDGLGRPTSKQVRWSHTKQTYEGSVPKPSSITTPKGDTYHFKYEPQLNYGLLTSMGVNDQTNYQHDVKSMAPLQLDDLYYTNHLEYLLFGSHFERERLYQKRARVVCGVGLSKAGRLQSYIAPNGQRQKMQ